MSGICKGIYGNRHLKEKLGTHLRMEQKELGDCRKDLSGVGRGTTRYEFLTFYENKKFLLPLLRMIKHIYSRSDPACLSHQSSSWTDSFPEYREQDWAPPEDSKTLTKLSSWCFLSSKWCTDIHSLILQTSLWHRNGKCRCLQMGTMRKRWPAPVQVYRCGIFPPPCPLLKSCIRTTKISRTDLCPLRHQLLKKRWEEEEPD